MKPLYLRDEQICSYTIMTQTEISKERCKLDIVFRRGSDYVILAACVAYTPTLYIYC